MDAKGNVRLKSSEKISRISRDIVVYEDRVCGQQFESAGNKA